MKSLEELGADRCGLRATRDREEGRLRAYGDTETATAYGFDKSDDDNDDDARD